MATDSELDSVVLTAANLNLTVNMRLTYDMEARRPTAAVAGVTVTIRCRARTERGGLGGGSHLV